MLVVNHPDRSQYLNLPSLTETPEFLKLSPLQRRFVVFYAAHGLETGEYNALLAVRDAIGESKPNLQVRASQLLNNSRVRRVLDLHFKRSELQVLLDSIPRAAKKSNKLGLLSPAVGKALIAFEKFVQEQGEKP
jgi:hypothetical protein